MAGGRKRLPFEFPHLSQKPKRERILPLAWDRPSFFAVCRVSPDNRIEAGLAQGKERWGWSRAGGMTGSKKRRPAITADDDRRQKTIVCPTLDGSFS